MREAQIIVQVIKRSGILIKQNKIKNLQFPDPVVKQMYILSIQMNAPPSPHCEILCQTVDYLLGSAV